MKVDLISESAETAERSFSSFSTSAGLRVAGAAIDGVLEASNSTEKERERKRERQRASGE